MTDAQIKVENLSKKFCRGLKQSLWYGMQDLGSELLGRPHGGDGELRNDEFWAIKDVNFELKRGECLGLIGANGAGKSSLLKMLNGLLKPDNGRITIHGRVGALIELGSGFNPVLSGRENVYVNGSVLGFTKQEIDWKFNDIAEFADIGEFIDAPVQSYSSGMKVRLGFAVASQMEPDILLIDEVLAVGDVGFRSRCFNAINKIQKNAAIIFVSHAMPQVARICTEVMLLNKGEVIYQGQDVPKGIEAYYENFESESSMVSGSGRAEILSTQLSSNGKVEVTGERFTVKYLDDLTIELYIRADSSIDTLNVNVAFFDKELRGVAQIYSNNSDFRLLNDKETLRVKVHVDQVNFNPGIYTLSLILTDQKRGETLINHHAIKNFHVTGPFIGFTPVQLRGDWSRIN